jgi:hypothetical protein
MAPEAHVPEKVMNYVEGQETISIEDVMRDFDVSRITAKNYLSRVARMNLIKSVGRGLYQRGRGTTAVVELPPELSQLAQYLRESFPMTSFVIWSLDMLADYTHYSISRNLVFLEADKTLSTSMRDALLRKGYHVILDPENRDFREYAYYNEKLLFILERKEEYGLAKVGKFSIPTLERIWLDLYYFITRRELSFSPSELGAIFGNMLNRDGINFNRLLRYASRRGLRDEVIIYLYSLKKSSQLPIPNDVLAGRREALKIIEEMVVGARE